MKTIEERFEEFAALACINSDTPEYHIAKAFWLQSANEQKAIDDAHLREVKKMVIDKACVTYEKDLRQMKWRNRYGKDGSPKDEH